MQHVIQLLGVVAVVAACSAETSRSESPLTENTDQRDGVKAAGTAGLTPEPEIATSRASAETESPREQRNGSESAPRPAQPRNDTPPVNDRAAVLKDFDARVLDYVKLRKRADDGAPPLKTTEDPAKIKAAQDARAAAIRTLRATAKPGDIFTADVRRMFRQLLVPPLKGEQGRDLKEILRDDAPTPGAIPLQVNAKYPETSPLPTVPAKLLLNLPRLPEGLEYRIIGKDLVLLDTDSNLIVDFMRNAIS